MEVTWRHTIVIPSRAFKEWSCGRDIKCNWPTLRGCATGCQRYTKRNVVALAAVARGFARLSCFTCVLGSWSGVMCMPLS